ncbi:hypothetical protein [Shewanella sp. UCD-KL12]|uniref:hypothetical protein n=1 Tax=Shewanella sp. UCD-KL12 TaxID=1917163 RepID=UPI0009707C8D|nr:hypothetical protein [Shewanella sp. UCD-KL12]
MKSKPALALFALLTSSLTTPLVMAHPGHDHQHWSASLIHLLWILPLVAAIGLAVTLYRRQKAANGSDQ